MRSTLHLLCALATSGLFATAQGQAPADRLYRDWGQKEGIRAVMQDFVPRLRADPRLGSFFKDTNEAHLVTQLTEQLCEQAGGPCVYQGVPMKEAHESMEIGRREFNALIEVLQQSMDAKGIPFAAQNAMLARLAPLHRDVINKP